MCENRWAVVGFNRVGAGQIIEDIIATCGKTRVRGVWSNYGIRVEFSDGTVLRWVHAAESSRGQRIGKMWCDKNIDREIYNCVIRPFYRGKTEDIIWL